MAHESVLVVEDDVIIARAIQDTLADFGYSVPALVSSGEAAIERAGVAHPDLILMDIRLAGEMDGVEAAERIKSLYDIPVVYMTAYADEKLLSRAKLTEPYGYLIKPFQNKDLHATVEMACYKHRMDKRLRESEERYRAVVTQALDGILLFEPLTGLIQESNPSLQSMLGYSGEEIRKLGIKDLMGSDFEGLERDIEHILTHKYLVLGERQYRRKDGSLIDVFVSASLIDGGHDNISLVIHDLTDRKKAEAELLKVKKLEAIGLLVGGIAHDFNNLLSVVLGNVNMAQLEVESESTVHKLLDDAAAAVLKARDLTNRFITFSEGGAPQKKLVSIPQMITEICGLALSGSNVKCDYFFGEDLWQVEIDQTQMNRVIYNITANAREAMPEGGTIDIWAANFEVDPKDKASLAMEEGKYVRISIKDHGSGVPAANLEKIFDPYFSTKDRGSQKGMGLGLTTAHSIVSKHNGYIHAESEVGVGTVLHVYLPASTKEIEKTIGSQRMDTPWDPSPAKVRVLLMDDEEMMRIMARKMLHRMGYEDVEMAVDGAEAIERFTRAKESGNPFDLVILDLTVRGGMGGKEVIRELIKIDPAVRAIVSSGYSTDPVMAHFREYGFQGALAKPYEMRELSEVLGKACSIA